MPSIMDRINAGLLGPSTNYGGIIDQGAQDQARQQAQTAMYAQLLQAGGYSPQRTTLGQAVGGAMQAGQQAQSQGLQQALQAQLLKSQIARNDRVTVGGDGVGDYQPRDYTAASWAEFVKGEKKDPSVLERFLKPKAEPMPSFRPVTRTHADGSTEQGSFDTRTNTFHWSGEVVPAGVKERAEAEGKVLGEASGGQGSKAPAKASFDAALGNLRSSIKDTPQGMVAGPLGTVTAYGDKKLFQSRVQQLSTELRTVYRIPGEGTLSDQEQQQYGLQLPSTDFPPDVNEQILADLEQRTALRLETPVGDAPKSATAPKKPQAGGGKKKTAAERAAALGL